MYVFIGVFAQIYSLHAIKDLYKDVFYLGRYLKGFVTLDTVNKMTINELLEFYKTTNKLIEEENRLLKKAHE
jgi:hypothetical protein